ncbi:hypothetical protein [Escherichia coli]|uniref:hypothetical protein n=1 Tax=Escherichia coli TaxID=562 RepID=UPI00209B6B3A|nr:hypothetical protein [Escherichia coli]MCO7789337.1 hypothetical protein [Escherichia coli]MCO7808196.1 hypothetical protein [Escherichia coli]
MTWELILDGYSESSYSATPRFAAARLPWFILLTSLINYFYVDNTVSLCMKSGRAASLKIQELTETLLSLSTYTLHIL